MQEFYAKEVSYTIIKSNDVSVPPFPYLRDSSGNRTMICVSPNHGRSYIVSKKDRRYIVSKGNGLSYTQYCHVNSGEFDDYTWGILLENEAVRDFEIGIEVHDLGIKTNIMQYVIKLEDEILLTNGHVLTPVLLQYSVECPYRICDAAYMSKEEIWRQVALWGKYNKRGSTQSYMVAAEVLVNNLKILHSNSPQHPYSTKEEFHIVQDLFPREIMQTYDVINHIASCLNETINHAELEDLFLRFGFDIKNCKSIYEK